MAAMVRAVFLAEVGWPGLAGGQPAWRAPHSRRRAAAPAEQRSRAPSAGSCEEAAESGESSSPLAAEAAWARRVPQPVSLIRPFTSSGFQSPSGTQQPRFPLGECPVLLSPSSLSSVAPWRERASPSTTAPPAPIHSKDYCNRHVESAPYNVSLETPPPPASKGMNLSVSRESPAVL